MINLIRSIDTQRILLRPFIYPADKPDIAEFYSFIAPLGITNETEPAFVQFEPYKNGYTFSFEFTTTDKFSEMAEWAQDNINIDVLIPDAANLNLYYRLGGKYGFKIIQFNYGFTPDCPSRYVVKLQTARPSLTPYAKLNYS